MLKKLFLINIFLLTLAQFSNISSFLGISDFKLYLFDIFISLYAVLGLFRYGVVKKKLLIPKYLYFLGIFTLVAAISLVPNFDKYADTFGIFYLVRWVFYLLSAVVTFQLIKDKELTKAFILRTFIYSGIALSLIGFAQLIFVPDFTVLDPVLGWDPHQNRIASTFFDPNFLGGYLVLLVTVLLFNKNLFIKHRNKIISLFLITIFLTYSRSAWGMLSLVIFFFGLKKSVWIILVSFILVFAAYFAVPRIQTRIIGITDPADSASFRLTSWKQTLSIVDDNLLIGVGFNNIKQAKIEYGFLTPDTLRIHSASGADSSLLLVLATTGVIGVLVFVLAFFFPAVNSPSFYMIAIVGGLFLESQFINSLFYPQIMFFWLTFFSLESV